MASGPGRKQSYWDGAIGAKSDEELVHEGPPGSPIPMISHRLVAITRCNRILVVDNGWIVEEGRREALLERGGLYKSLWTRKPAAPRRDSHQPSAIKGQ